MQNPFADISRRRVGLPQHRDDPQSKREVDSCASARHARPLVLCHSQTMTRPGVRRIVLFTLGWIDLPRAISVHGDRSGQHLREPVPGVLLECDGGWFLLDTGINPALVRDAALFRRFHGQDGTIKTILPGTGDPLEDALDRIGLHFDDIVGVALSHLHYDHAGGIRHFAGRVPIHLQRAELDFGLSDHPVPEHHGMFRVDYDDPRIDWRLATGDAELAPGVEAILTAGHTPGHQSFVVSLDDRVGGGGFIFAFDAADLTENIEHELAIGDFINCDAADTLEPIRRLKAIAAERGYRLIPGHDPRAWPQMTDELAKRWPAES